MSGNDMGILCRTTCPQIFSLGPWCHSHPYIHVAAFLRLKQLHAIPWVCIHGLADYPDCKFVSAILNIIDVGASIGHSGPQTSQSCNNLRSALDHSAVVSKEIDSLLSEGHIHGPFAEPPLSNFCCSPLGTSTHRCNPKGCVFNNFHGLKVTQSIMRCMTKKAPSNMTLSLQQQLHCGSLEEDHFSPNWTSRMHTGTYRSIAQTGT